MQHAAGQLRREVMPTSASVPSGVSMRAGFSTRPRTTIAAACSAVIGGTGLSRRDGAIIGVFTSGMWMLVNVMWSDSVSVRHHVGERVERGLARQVGAVLRAARLHARAGHVDHMAEPAFAPVRQQREHHPHRAEVVDGHHPFVVVQPVGGAATDRRMDRPALLTR